MAAKPRILLVDDRAENLTALEAILSSLNQVLVPVRSGDEALKALLSGEFAVILLDVVMPGMDGFETAAHIKRRAKTRDIPIIFLTAASSEPDYAFRGYAAGAVDYIAKPFDPWVLRAKVSIFVELYMKNLQLREQAELMRSQLATAPGLAEGGAAAELAADAMKGSRDAGGGAGGTGAEPLLTELSGRLAAVEDLVAVISGQAVSGQDPVMIDCTARLEHRVGRLRDALDALRVGG
ncbi:MAG TPA: response regulator [Trebonia sp.]|nr:response regulator [Trebonia sp.]